MTLAGFAPTTAVAAAIAAVLVDDALLSATAPVGDNAVEQRVQDHADGAGHG